MCWPQPPKPDRNETEMKVKVINLASRTDRWQSMQEQLRAFGVSDYERFDAYTGGATGFNKSVHYALKDEQELLLLEDDCIFLGTYNDLIAAKAKLPDDWDMLYLGANVLTPQKQYTDGIWHLDNAWTSHAILYSDKGAEWCYKNFQHDDVTIYDEWLRTVAQKQLKCFIMNPMIAVQSQSYSDIWGVDADYDIKQTETHLQ